MFWIFIIAIGLSWVAQSALSFKQAKAFSTLFVDMRRRGRVAMGKFRGGIVQGEEPEFEDVRRAFASLDEFLRAFVVGLDSQTMGGKSS